ncbi:PfkB family carbohydrate kinase [Massilia antarctica]|uniref:PfkB family carbohydrate kinase n=1 Tax=Massilia antarctica TaxID=2765360 RepID=UPI0006BB92F3|nr:PfkB family carbohydrate kinase [Massilia sp. H27-R4]MCY0915361.1 PfkB family carbohydrate kinase [Massilia sp. H27-R4]CUI05823.1 Fructokinase [Janthinobacterium sp. CG23_2]CUU29609.1 Fructokinase [Janthinobacterium sp. CG23_2]
MTTVVYGEALVDDFSSGQVVGGAPFNVARHLAAFMSPQLAITRIGDDSNGALVRAEFERFAMSDAGLQLDRMEETGRVAARRHARGRRLVILPGQAYDYINPEQALAAMEAVEASTIYFGTLAQRCPRSRDTLYALLDTCNASRYLDLNLREGQFDERCVFHSLHAADIAKVNEEELQSLFAWYADIHPSSAPLEGEEVRAACAVLVQLFGLEALIVTLGHRGSVYFGADGTVLVHRDNPLPPFVIDTVGAGDAFSAMFLLGRQRGWELGTTLARANEFAGAVCTIPGAIPGNLAFYDKWVARWRIG